jgi:hypothetical protein
MTFSRLIIRVLNISFMLALASACPGKIIGKQPRHRLTMDIATLHDFSMCNPCSFTDDISCLTFVYSHTVGFVSDDFSADTKRVLLNYFSGTGANIHGPYPINGGFRFVVTGSRSKLVPTQNTWEFGSFEFEWFQLGQPNRKLQMTAEVRTIPGKNRPRNEFDKTIYTIQNESTYQGAAEHIRDELSKALETKMLKYPRLNPSGIFR